MASLIQSVTRLYDWYFRDAPLYIVISGLGYSKYDTIPLALGLPLDEFHDTIGSLLGVRVERFTMASPISGSKVNVFSVEGGQGHGGIHKFSEVIREAFYSDQPRRPRQGLIWVIDAKEGVKGDSSLEEEMGCLARVVTPGEEIREARQGNSWVPRDTPILILQTHMADKEAASITEIRSALGQVGALNEYKVVSREFEGNICSSPESVREAIEELIGLMEEASLTFG